MSEETKKRRLFRKRWILLGGVVAIIATAVVIVTMVSSFFTKNYLASEIENSINARVEIGEIDLSIFSPTVMLKLKQVKLAKRDSFARDAVLHDERPVLKNEQLSLELASIEISWFQLLSKKIVVKSILIDQLNAHITLKKNGKNSLETLLAKPKDRKKSKDKSANKKNKGEDSDTFNVFSHGDFMASLKDFQMRDSELSLIVEASDLKVKASGVSLDLLEEFTFKLEDLATMDPTKFHMDAELNLYSRGEEVHYGKMELGGDVLGKVFNPGSGDFQPELDVQVSLVEGSYLRKIPVIEKVSDAFIGITEIPMLEKLIQSKWDKSYVFGKGQQLHLKFKDNTYTFTKPLKADVGGWDLRLEKGGWFRSTDNLHSFNYSVIASDKISGKVKGSMEKVVKILPSKLRGKSQSEMQKLFDSQGRFVLKFKTMGSLSSPKVSVLSKLPEVGRLTDQLLDGVEKELKKGLMDLLNR